MDCLQRRHATVHASDRESHNYTLNGDDDHTHYDNDNDSHNRDNDDAKLLIGANTWGYNQQTNTQSNTQQLAILPHL